MNTPGYADVLIGLQYGDEGKAKIIDILADDYDIIARFNGGANAGHTVKTDRGTVALKQIPSGIFYDDTDLYIGSGCAVHPVKLIDEIELVEKLGISLSDRLRISDQATLIQPHHIHIDKIAGEAIGTTANGIGPAYADRCMRMFKERKLHIRLGDFIDSPVEVLETIAKNYAATLESSIDDPLVQKEIVLWEKSLHQLVNYIERDTLYLQNRVRSGCKVLFEGAQSCMLDVSKGTSPYVTSSNTIAGAPYVGGDLSPQYHRKTIGVAKAIMSRVGNGPFPSEFGGTASEEYCMEENGQKYTRSAEEDLDTYALLKSGDEFEIGRALRKLSNEYGTGTGRPRRVGALDLVQLRYAILLNGVTDLYINKCDLLKEFANTKENHIPIVTSYTLDGTTIDYVPGTTVAHKNVQCNYEYRPTFSDEISDSQTKEGLPPALTDLLQEIEDKVGCKLYGIGVGPDREDHINL